MATLWYDYRNEPKTVLRACYEPSRWGLPAEAADGLSDRLGQLSQRYRTCFVTQTRDGHEHAETYLRGQLTMDAKRNFANVERRVAGGDGQAIQHFMSKSPWSGQAVFDQIKADIRATPELAQGGGWLILDESADEKAGERSAGAGRQHNGRLGKIGVCQVATCLTYAHPGLRVWALVDGELFLPEAWFSPAYAERRAQVEVPANRAFATKPALGLRMIQRAQAAGVPFERVACDELYGRNQAFRATLDEAQIGYAAQVPANTLVYEAEPRVGVPRRRYRHGQAPKRLKVLSPTAPREVCGLARSRQTHWERVRVRPTERGWLEAEFAVQRIWTVAAGHPTRAEWLVMKREADGDIAYTLLNAPPDTPAQTLIEWSCQRYFTERAFQDAKAELGWAEFQALKYRAWEHHMALTALALWFIAETKLDWRTTYARDPELAHEMEVEVLPALSTANVREMLKAALPLPQLTPEAATQLVVRHLVNRARSISSRLEAHNHRGFD
jgi:SRSO17 transposase